MSSSLVGETISHYHVLSEIGGGGMGVVYRAADVRLGREVALKFLPPTLARQQEALDRFLREARMASALNHPNICTIHDIGRSDEHDGQPYIVMELLEGSTLKQTIGGSPLPIDRLLEVAVQIGEALTAAHRRGIVHRDVKPANVYITRSGQVKVLDFGLAKLTQDGRGASDSNASSSASTASESVQELTRPGLQIGTLAYMSPEQARGEAVDARTDLFSFGAVLYEMATGRRAFAGTTSAIIFDAILNRAPEPPFEFNPEIPEELVRIIDKALEKDRGLRYQDAADLVADLRRLQRGLDPERSSTVLSVMTRTPSAARLPELWPSAVESKAAPRRRGLWLAVIVAAVAVVAAGAWYFAWRRPVPLSDRDSIVLGDVQNKTGEPVFDGTLRQALAVQLGQSPFLNIVPDNRVRETLGLMGRPADEPLTAPVAREVCQRQGLKAMIHGDIARIGTLYVVTLEALNCETAEAIARQQGDADTQERVLATIGTLAKTLRGTLGESIGSIEKYHTPIEMATTPSLEALRAYTLAVAQRARGGEIESIPFFQRALELDQKFTSAYTMLSTVYGNLGETAKSEEYARKAYELRGQLSERERLLVTFQYHDRVTGDLEQVVSSLNVWKQSFPRDYTPANSLVVILNRLGRFDAAVPNGEEAIRRNPSHGFPYSNLAQTLRALGRYDESRATAERAVALKIETLPTRRLLYHLALMRGDTDEAAQHRAWARDRTREFDFVGAEAEVNAYRGKMNEARALYRRAIEMAEQRNLRETASGYRANTAMLEAAIGNRAAAQRLARELLAQAPTDVPKLRAVSALALAGSPTEAHAAVREMAPRYPTSTMMKQIYLPTALGAAALGEGRPDRAIEALAATVPYDFGFVASLSTTYHRAQAYLMKGAAAEAVREFQSVIDHRGTSPFSVFIPLSHLGMARAYGKLGEAAKQQAAFQAFFELWKDGDADVPVLVEARREAKGQ